MNQTDTAQIDWLYLAFKNLPFSSYNEEGNSIETIVARDISPKSGNKKVFYAHLKFDHKKYPGINGRRKIWKDILAPLIQKASLENIFRQSGVYVKDHYVNGIFRSKYTLEGDNLYVEVWSPKLSTLLGKPLGKRVKAIFNYTP